jgi:hypothetical protein
MNTQKPTFSILLVGLFVLLLAAPLLCMVGGGSWTGALGGVEEEYRFPILSWGKWFSGALSQDIDGWANRNIGCRAWLIKAGSQINYSLFQKIKKEEERLQIVVGKDYWLFRQDYIDILKRPPPKTNTRKLISDLGKVRSRLGTNDVEFVVVIAPNKAYVYPDKLGGQGALKGRPPWSQGFAELLKSNGIFVVNGNDMFIAHRKLHPCLFPPGGIHWSYYGAWLAWESIAEDLRAHATLSLGKQAVRDFRWCAPEGMDSDLRELLNLWRFESGGVSPMPYPVVEPPASGEARYSALIMGDSFSFQLIDAMARSGRFSKLALLYYGKTVYAYQNTSFSSRDQSILMAGRLADEKKATPWKQWRYRKGLPTKRKDFSGDDPKQWSKVLDGVDLVIVAVSEINFTQEWLSTLMGQMAATCDAR